MPFNIEQTFMNLQELSEGLIWAGDTARRYWEIQPDPSWRKMALYKSNSSLKSLQDCSWEGARHGHRVRNSKHDLKWDNQTRYQQSHFVHEDSRHWDRPEILSNHLNAFQVWLCKASWDPFLLLLSYNPLWTWTKLLGGKLLLEISSLNNFQIK